MQWFQKNIKMYYCDKDICIVNADCLDILKKMPDKSVDLIITDPPYGMSYHSGHYKDGNPFKPLKGDDRYPSEIIPICKQKARKAVFSFCRWDNLHEVEKPTSFIVWIKNNWTAGDLEHAYGRQWEGILFYPLEEHKFSRRNPDVIDCRRIPYTEIVHPTQKPVDLIKWILRNNSEKNDLILDFFLGSGTTLCACKELGRRGIGIEIDETYCKIAKERLLGTMVNLL